MPGQAAGQLHRQVNCMPVASRQCLCLTDEVCYYRWSPWTYIYMVMVMLKACCLEQVSAQGSIMLASLRTPEQQGKCSNAEAVKLDLSWL